MNSVAEDNRRTNNMRTIRTKIYKFNELSKEAQQNAINDYRSIKERYGYAWSEDALNSLKKFAEHFNCELKEYSISWDSENDSWVIFNIPFMKDISRQVVQSYIEGMGSYNADTLQGDGDCVFTGYTADEDAAFGAREAFYQGINDIHDLLNKGYTTWISACVTDYNYSLSDEAIIDDINSFEFYKDGKRYNY